MVAPIQREIQRATEEEQAHQVRVVHHLRKIGGNAFKFNFHPYMGIYSMLNTNQLKLSKPSSLNEDVNEEAMSYIVEELISCTCY